MLTANPTNSRLKYVWEKQKPQVDPEVMMDLIEAVATRIMGSVVPGKETWASRIEAAAKKADPKFAATFIRWEWRNDPINSAPYSVVEAARDAGEVDAAFVDAVLAMVVVMPEFRKAAPIDGLIPWFAKQLDAEWRAKSGQDASERAYGRSMAAERMYRRLLAALAVEPVLTEWFEKKKPNLSKLDASDAFDEIEKFEEDREPEVVYTGKTQDWEDESWDVVKLATKTQIQKVGEELDNCLKKGSSYTEGYCAKAKAGTSEFFALRKDGEPVLSIQWSPGQKDPEQVYGADNSEPEGDAEEKVSEWIESRGGKRRRWSRLSDSAREIAEYIEEHDGSHEDDDTIAVYAQEWDDAFSVDNAKKWIDDVGAYDLELARKLDDEKLDADDFGGLLAPVRKYIFEHWQDGSRTRKGEVEEAISLGLLANEMIARQGNRIDNAPKPPPLSSQVEFGHEGFGRSGRAIEERERREKAADAEIAEGILDGLRTSGDDAETTSFLVAAKKWLDAGWADRDYFDDAADWWAAWFSPEDAATYYFDLAHIDRKGQGVTLDVARELRARGITAQEVMDAARTLPKTLNIRSADAIAEAVTEDRRLHANKRRRTSRRPAQRARAHR